MLCLWTLIAEHYSRPFGDYRIAKTCTLWESISLRYPYKTTAYSFFILSTMLCI